MGHVSPVETARMLAARGMVDEMLHAGLEAAVSPESLWDPVVPFESVIEGALIRIELDAVSFRRVGPVRMLLVEDLAVPVDSFLVALVTATTATGSSKG